MLVQKERKQTTLHFERGGFHADVGSVNAKVAAARRIHQNEAEDRHSEPLGYARN